MPEDRDNTSPDIVLLQNLKIDREDAEIMESDGVLQYFLSVSDAGGNIAYRLVIMDVSRGFGITMIQPAVQFIFLNSSSSLIPSQRCVNFAYGCRHEIRVTFKWNL